MGLSFKVLDSPQNEIIGTLVPLFEGLLIGRSRGHWIVEDNRISSTHAEIQSNNQGHLLLVDKGSRNGIKVQGRNISKLLLFPGLILQIGDTLVEVQHIDDQVLHQSNQDETQGLVSQAMEIVSKIDITEHERDYVKPQFFPNPVHLEVIQGLQLNQQWILDYGPFRFGSGSIGGLLVGQNMPELVFEIFLGSRGPMIRPLTTERILKLNSIPLISESILENKDILTITLPNENITRIRFNLN
ncbi:MAG: FHA domain-containing protein [Bdellovibrionaceae bacterium]|nr:FHA domain-containing protein [Pseudobdellovibrionaceae bacterium]